jgi:hypothetical protein
LRNARRAGVPLVAVSTPDPADTVAEILSVAKIEHPVLLWDCLEGLRPSGQPERARVDAEALASLAEPLECPRDQVGLATINPAACLIAARHLPHDSWVVMYGAHRLMDDGPAIQAIWALRDVFKSQGQTLILTGPQINLAPELVQDVMAYDDPFPSDEEIGRILVAIYRSAEIDGPAAEALPRYINALRGLSAFAVEQVAYFSLSRSGMDEEKLRDRQRRMVEQTPGLKFHFAHGQGGFGSIVGLDPIKSLAHGLFGSSRNVPECVILVDEVEKWASGIGGQKGDSGVSQDALGVTLRVLVENDYPGLTLVGFPGTGKTVVAHAIAAEFKRPLIEIDYGAMKGSLVGESEAKIRQAWKVVASISGGSALLVACANGLPDIPEALMSRIGKLGTYFVDLPDARERRAIWDIKKAKYGIEDRLLPSDEHWTGREIDACCDIASRINAPLIEAAGRVVPIAVSAPERISKLREQASGRWLSAQTLGAYVNKAKSLPMPKGATERRVDLE